MNSEIAYYMKNLSVSGSQIVHAASAEAILYLHFRGAWVSSDTSAVQNHFRFLMFYIDYLFVISKIF